jgi:UTP-glucose-1-phosphate uridylyltransferase
MRSTIRKAVIPAAGIGSRLLPMTKAIPKEMLPVGDKPVVEHTVRELVSSGITDITIVVSGGKSLIQDHFRPNPVLVEQLRADDKAAYADAVEEVGELSHRGHITYLDQHGAYGNGTPVLNAARSFGDEPSAARTEVLGNSAPVWGRHAVASARSAAASWPSSTALISVTKLLTPHVGERIGCRRCREAA